MILLFVGGVTNLLWIAALALLVLIEKLLPVGPHVSRLTGIALIVGGESKYFDNRRRSMFSTAAVGQSRRARIGMGRHSARPYGCRRAWPKRRALTVEDFHRRAAALRPVRRMLIAR
jgi:hypothetical protein